VGKSFLGNILLKEECFEHKLKATAVTTATEFKSFILKDGREFSVFNIPGLIENNQAAIERNKVEIDKAFVARPFSIILYVFGQVGGRIRDEDVIAFQALDKAYGLQRHSICFLVNDLPATTPPNYEAETKLVVEELLQIKKNIKIEFTMRVAANDTTGKTNIYNNLLRLITQCCPDTHVKKQEITLKADEIREMKKQMKEVHDEYEKKVKTMTEQITKLQADYEKEKNKAPQVIHHPPTVERQRGISIGFGPLSFGISW